MQPLSAFPAAARRAVRGVLADIDDTLTTDGRLTAEAYGAMEHLRDAGFRVLPITGRPAGWGDHIARMWPVDGVVGENGAFYFRYDHAARRMTRRYVISADERRRDRERLAELQRRILDAVPGAGVSADQSYREADLAIDFREDVAPLSDRDIETIVGLFEAAGATAKVSSIHVNGWFGSYDKLTTTRLMMTECFEVDLAADRARYVFVGDSPNDAPMFDFFPHAVGVANIRAMRDRLNAAPAYVTEAPAGAGFAELAALLIAAGSG